MRALSISSTYKPSVPAIVTAVLRSPLLPRSHAIEGITYGGSPPPQRLAADITQRWPLVALSHGFGMTETNGIATCVAGPDYLERPESVGHPNPISDIKIVDPESKKPLPPGEVGLLLCHGSNLMKGYVDNPSEHSCYATRTDGARSYSGSH